MTKISRLEHTILSERSSGNWHHAGSPRTTIDKLIEKGLFELRGRKVAKSGRLIRAGEVRITDSGKQLLGV